MKKMYQNEGVMTKYLLAAVAATAFAVTGCDAQSAMNNIRGGVGLAERIGDKVYDRRTGRMSDEGRARMENDPYYRDAQRRIHKYSKDGRSRKNSQKLDKAHRDKERLEARYKANYPEKKRWGDVL